MEALQNRDFAALPFQIVKKARNRQNQNNKRGYPKPKQGFFPCHPERTRRIFAVSKEKRFFVTAFLRMTYKERFCCNPACSARILTSVTTRALPYLCTPTGASCSASGAFLTVCQRAEKGFFDTLKLLQNDGFAAAWIIIILWRGLSSKRNTPLRPAPSLRQSAAP